MRVAPRYRLRICKFSFGTAALNTNESETMFLGREAFAPEMCLWRDIDYILRFAKVPQRLESGPTDIIDPSLSRSPSKSMHIGLHMIRAKLPPIKSSAAPIIGMRRTRLGLYHAIFAMPESHVTANCSCSPIKLALQKKATN